VYKKSIENSQPFVRKMRNVRTPWAGFFWLTLYTSLMEIWKKMWVGVFFLNTVYSFVCVFFCSA